MVPRGENWTKWHHHLETFCILSDVLAQIPDVLWCLTYTMFYVLIPSPELSCLNHRPQSVLKYLRLGYFQILNFNKIFARLFSWNCWRWLFKFEHWWSCVLGILLMGHKKCWDSEVGAEVWVRGVENIYQQLLTYGLKTTLSLVSNWNCFHSLSTSSICLNWFYPVCWFWQPLIGAYNKRSYVVDSASCAT